MTTNPHILQLDDSDDDDLSVQHLEEDLEEIEEYLLLQQIQLPDPPANRTTPLLYQALFDILRDSTSLIRDAFMGFYTGDGIHGERSAGIGLRSTEFVWLYQIARRFGINQPSIR